MNLSHPRVLAMVCLCASVALTSCRSIYYGAMEKIGFEKRDLLVRAVKNAKAGQVRYRSDKAGVVHCTIGKADFDAAKLKDNLHALLQDLQKAA